MTTSTITNLGTLLYSVVARFASFVGDIFFTTLSDLIGLYIEQADGMPLLQSILTDILNRLTSNFPDLATATFFEFCCGSALVLTLVISLIKWLIGIFK